MKILELNLLACSVVILQLGGGIWYLAGGSRWFGLLWILYGVTNVLLIVMEAKG